LAVRDGLWLAKSLGTQNELAKRFRYQLRFV
jgi:hypothetical protein